VCFSRKLEYPYKCPCPFGRGPKQKKVKKYAPQSEVWRQKGKTDTPVIPPAMPPAVLQGIEVKKKQE